MKKVSKAILSGMWWLIYHKTNTYVTTKIEYGDLHYVVYHLYRIDIFLGIEIKVFIDKASSLNEVKRNQWYYNYTNLKEI